MHIKQAYLLFAFIVVSVIALLYGLSPAWFARSFLGVNELNNNIAHILRAMMGLYIALGLFWLYAAFHQNYRDGAILTTVIFCVGLVAGRLVSLVADGRPANLLLLYVAMEFALAPIGLWILRRPD
jgi:Na+-driven multidrug efflux pump